MEKDAQIDTASQSLLKAAMLRLNLSAETIANLDLSEKIQLQNVAEFIQYRTLDRENRVQ